MDLDEGKEQLTALFKGRDWFHDVGTDQYGRYVVYINFTTHESLHDVPDRVNGKQVLVHFVGSKTAKREDYTKAVTSSLHKFSELKDKMSTEQKARVDEMVKEALDIIDAALDGESEEQSLRHLQNELERLEKACGSHTLQDIFYEVQDGKNAVTNLSERYPDVRKDMEKLFDQYGFDVIYEELDG